jgi:hypothetical protein
MKCIIVVGVDVHIDPRKKSLSIFEKHGYQMKELIYGAGTPGYQLYLNIVEEDPDLLVTLDLAGF